MKHIERVRLNFRPMCWDVYYKYKFKVTTLTE